jgi:hypothetical protein
MNRYLRKWRITASTDTQSWILSTSEDAAALRCVFITDEFRSHTVFGTLQVFNLSMNTINALTAAARQNAGALRIIIEAGYENEMGIIWNGAVYQLYKIRENVTDWVLMFETVNSQYNIGGDFINYSIGAGESIGGHIEAVCKNAHKPIEISSISNSVSKDTTSRGAVYFGSVHRELRKLGKKDGLYPAVQDEKISMYDDLADHSNDEPFVLTPQTGLVGTPTQIQWGVNVRALIHPKLRWRPLCTRIKLDKVIIRMTAIQPDGNHPLKSPLEPDGTYHVIGSAFTGDTRGNDWYVDLRCMNNAGMSLYRTGALNMG